MARRNNNASGFVLSPVRSFVCIILNYIILLYRHKDLLLGQPSTGEVEAQKYRRPSQRVGGAFKIKLMAGSWEQFCLRRRNEEECCEFRLKLELQINSRAYCYGPLRFI